MVIQEPKKHMEILLIEDSRSDAVLVREALKELKTLHRLTILEDGEQALAYLRCQGEHVAQPLPDLILLDLDLPKKSGHDLLAEIKNDPSLCRIPVIVLTESHDRQDIERSYQLHANSYIVKPPNFDRLLEVIRSVEEFWFTVATLFDDEGGAEPRTSRDLPTNGHSSES